MESEDGGAVVCEPGCLVLESDFLLSGALEFGDAEIMGLDRDTGEFIGNARIKEGRNDHWTATPVSLSETHAKTHALMKAEMVGVSRHR